MRKESLAVTWQIDIRTKWGEVKNLRWNIQKSETKLHQRETEESNPKFREIQMQWLTT